MHLYFWVRGVRHQIALFEALAQGIFWRFKRTSPEGEEKLFCVQGALRPSIWGAYEYILPDECLPEFLAMILNKTSIGMKDATPPVFPYTAKMWVIRKFFEAEKIPDEVFLEADKIEPSIIFPENVTKRCFSHMKIPGVSIHLIGIKKDKFAVFPTDEYFQEHL